MSRKLAKPHRDAIQLSCNHAEAVVAAPLHAMFEIALRNFAGIVGQHPDGMQHQHDGRHFNQDEGDEQRDGKMQLPGGSQSSMGGSNQPHAERGDHDTAENQPLREIQHLSGLRARENHTFILAH